MFVDIAGGDQELYDSDLQFERQAVNFYQDTDPTAKREDEVRPIMTRSPLGANVMHRRYVSMPQLKHAFIAALPSAIATRG